MIPLVRAAWPAWWPRCRPDLFIVATSIKKYGDGLEISSAFSKQSRNIPIILTTKESSEDLAISALRIGAKDYCKIPLNYAEFLKSVRRCLEDSWSRRQLI